MAFFIRNPQSAPQLLKSFRFLVIFILAAVAPLMLHVAGAQAIGGTLPPAGTWAGTGNLNTARFNHTATLLPNGQVMVTGGHDTSSTALSSVELYNPATGSWSYIMSLNTARCNHTATLLPNGQVLVAGGDNGSGVALGTAELYDPVMGYWTYTMPLNTARYSHTATLLPNGRVLLAGGANGEGTSLNSAEIFDPATGNWTPTGNLNTARLNHTATLLPNGRVLVAGGKDKDAGGNHLVSAELFDQAAASGAGAWTPTGDLNVARSFHTATLLPNGRVLAAGGEDRDDAEVYNPTDGTWTHIGFLYYGTRGFHTATLLPNGRVLLAGGYSGVNYLNSAELYDPVAGTFGTTGFLAGARKSHTATLLPSGLVLVAGGTDGTSSLNTSEVYASPPATWTAATGTWAATGNLNTARQNHTVTLLPNGNVLVAGGSNGSYLTSAELYDPVAGTWAITGSLATARDLHTATLLPNGKILVAGGYNASSGAQSSAELYDPVTGTWSATGSLSGARYGHTATLLPNGKVLVAGGYLGSFLNTAELYDPVTGTWSNTGFLLGGRVLHTATLLPNGKVLVVGGYLLASAEIYDPDAGTWSLTGSLNVGRWQQTTTLLPNGQVLVAGGYNVISGYLSSSEVYDPRYGTWTTTSGSLSTARSLHTANLLPNGGVLAAAGYNDSSGNLASAEVYDPATGNWSATGPLSIGCQLHRAILLPNGLVLATGGYNGSTALNTAQLYGVFHTITATSSTGGSISPSGAVAAEDGLPKTFTITPDAGYIVLDVLVDGESVGDVTSYTFPNVTTTHTITASFAINTVTITASAGPGGTILPSGAVPVNYGSDQIFSITPNTGYHIADVAVDGVSQGAVSSYTFSNVITGHTIAASFALDTFTISASADAGGTISPSGAVPVNYGSDQGFSITANTGYHIADVTVDGVSQGAVSSYNFSAVTANHTIAASFALDTFTITASAGGGEHFTLRRGVGQLREQPGL